MPINIKKGVNQLVNHINRDMPNYCTNLKLEEEIDFGSSEIRSFITLESIEKLEDKKFAITISFTTGTL